ncbi:KEOPS complex subunit Pcc1 [Natrononativus amylolyticus]|uniref:KEOPS complex subunit Pcc1 n=1 Tax=Natrononativus amylolyticus TaxID=2963434 RepID=UPI0020CCA5E1|nr:KEOPS complex subunit Pcc1 [Natrononativus amylolyticus]
MMRRATIRTTHADPATVAAATEPDNTDEMTTAVDADEDAVVTRIERETTGGLHSTVDDYVVNLEVAAEVVQQTTNTPDADARDGADTCASTSQERESAGVEASTTDQPNNE